jgi:hypothetical protein
MNYDSDSDINIDNSYNIENLLKNDTINDILENNFKMNFTIDCRARIENMKQKYINLYLGGGIFKNDEYNVNWERLFDIIYNSINKKYDLGIIYNDLEFFINILENKRLK